MSSYRDGMRTSAINPDGSAGRLIEIDETAHKLTARDRETGRAIGYAVYFPGGDPSGRWSVVPSYDLSQPTACDRKDQAVTALRRIAARWHG